MNEKRVKEAYTLIREPNQRMGTEQLPLSREEMANMVRSHFRASGQLIRLPGETFRRDAQLIEYVGESQITEINQHVTTETIGLSSSLAEVVKAERNAQETTMKGYVDDPKEARAFVWTVAGEPNLASIASWKVVTENDDVNAWKRHFHQKNPKGILGSFESERSDLVFIKPFWIWHVTYVS